MVQPTHVNANRGAAANRGATADTGDIRTKGPCQCSPDITLACGDQAPVCCRHETLVVAVVRHVIIHSCKNMRLLFSRSHGVVYISFLGPLERQLVLWYVVWLINYLLLLRSEQIGPETGTPVAVMCVSSQPDA